MDSIKNLPAPLSTNLVGAEDPTGLLQPLRVDADGKLITSAAVSVTIDYSGTPGAAVPADAAYVGGTDGTNLRGIKVDASGVVQTNIPSVITTEAGSAPGSLVLTGGLNADQTAAHTILVDQNGHQHVDIQSSALPTGAAEQANAASFAEDASVTSSAETFTAPSGAIGFVIQAPSSNTANVRFKCGGTASSSSGFLLEPGRSEILPVGVNISYAAESGTQALYVQWLQRT